MGRANIYIFTYGARHWIAHGAVGNEKLAMPQNKSAFIKRRVESGSGKNHFGCQAKDQKANHFFCKCVVCVLFSAIHSMDFSITFVICVCREGNVWCDFVVLQIASMKFLSSFWCGEASFLSRAWAGQQHARNTDRVVCSHRCSHAHDVHHENDFFF